MFFKKYGDIVVSVFFMAVSSVLIAMALMLPKSKVMEIGPDFMPLCIGSVTFVLSLVLLILSLKKFKMHASGLDPDAIPDCDYRRVLSSILLVLIYVFTMKPVGFILSTLIFLFLQMMVLAPDEQRTKKEAVKLIVVDVLFTLVVFFLFRYGFKIVLPAGIFTITL